MASWKPRKCHQDYVSDFCYLEVNLLGLPIYVNTKLCRGLT